MLHIFNGFLSEIVKMSKLECILHQKNSTFQLKIAELKSGDLHYLLYF